MSNDEYDPDDDFITALAEANQHLADALEMHTREGASWSMESKLEAAFETLGDALHDGEWRPHSASPRDGHGGEAEDGPRIRAECGGCENRSPWPRSTTLEDQPCPWCGVEGEYGLERVSTPLTVVHGIGENTAPLLEGGGWPDCEALAVADPAAVAEATPLSVERAAEIVDRAGAVLEHKADVLENELEEADLPAEGSTNRADKVRNAVVNLERRVDGAGVPVDDVVEHMGEEHGFKPGRVDRMIEHLKQQGRLYEPRTGEVSAT